MSQYTKEEWEISNTTLADDYMIVPKPRDGKGAIAKVYRREDAHLITTSPRMIEFIKKLVSEGNKEASSFLQTLDLS